MCQRLPSGLAPYPGPHGRPGRLRDYRGGGLADGVSLAWAGAGRDPGSRSRSRRLVWALLLVAVGSGCAASKPADLQVLTRRVEELAQKIEENQRETQELDSRLFLLEDKVDTLRVAGESSGKPPRLPVIRIQPEAEEPQPKAATATVSPAQPTASTQEEPVTGGQSVVESQDVVYEGEARRQGPRPILRLHGVSDRPSSLEPTLAPGIPPPAPTIISEKLPVIPIPRGRASDQAAASHQGLKTYQDGLRLYKASDHKGAIKTFEQFLKENKEHPYADNAQYWLGECYYDTREFRKALDGFRRVVELFPDGNKVPDALLKMGYCYIKLGERQSARNVLEQVVGSYPNSQVARLASAALATLK